jgi:hypothetical protein
VEGERIVAGPNARLRLHFLARNVYLVLAGHGTVSVTLDGAEREPLRVSGDRLYTLVSWEESRDGLLDLAFSPGIAAYAFTFG